MQKLLPVLFGIAVRRALVDYLRGVGLIMFILLAVAWTIDLARHFPSIRAAADLRPETTLGLLAPYLLHRGVDIVTRLLPMACLFGVLLAEVGRRIRLESVVLAAAGYAPWRRAAALLWLALILGTLQGMLESRWRPAAVFAQVESGFGNYAHWFRRDWLRRATWFVIDDLAIRAELRRTDDPEMRKILIFDGIRAPQLTRVISAERGLPMDEPLQWQLTDVRIWSDATDGRAPISQDTLDLEINLIPQQLSYHGIQEFNIPGPDLARLATRTDAPNAASVETAVWRRRTAWLLPGVFAVLAAALARLTFEARQLVPARALVLAALGYVSVVMVKVFWQLGMLGTLAAPAAVLLPLLSALLLTLVLARRRI